MVYIHAYVCVCIYVSIMYIYTICMYVCKHMHKYNISLLSLYITCILITFILELEFLHNLPLLAVLAVI